MDAKEPKPTTKQVVAKPKSSRPSAFDLFSKSIEALKVNMPLHLLFYFAPLLVGIVLFMVIIGSTTLIGTTSITSDTINTSAQEDFFNISMFFSFVGFFVAMIAINSVAFLANTYTGLMSARGKKTDFQTALRAGAKHIVPFLLASLLVMVVIGAGLLLFVIPGVVIGIYLLPRLMILMPVMMNENLGAIDALKRSDQIVKGGGIWEVVGVNVLFGLLGIIPILGGIVSAVLSFLYSLAPTFRVLEVSKAAAPAESASTAKPAV